MSDRLLKLTMESKLASMTLLRSNSTPKDPGPTLAFYFKIVHFGPVLPVLKQMGQYEPNGKVEGT